MQRRVLPALVVGTLLAFQGVASAQFFPGTTGYDPFNAYYGFYLPRQAALSMQRSTGPEAIVNSMSAARQEAAYTDRAALYDPVSRYGLNYQYDPGNPFPDRRQGARPGGLAINGSNIDGSGPQPYYNRMARYFPGTKAGRGPNANVYRPHPRTGGVGGMGGMGGMGGFR